MMVILRLLFMVMPLVLPLALHAEEDPRAMCESNHLLNIAYDCGCVAEKYAAARAKDSTTAFPDLMNDVLTKEVRPCIQPEDIHEAALKKCSEGYQLKRHLDRKKLGKEAFCQCVADESLVQLEGMDLKSVPTLSAGNTKALIVCGKKTE